MKLTGAFYSIYRNWLSRRLPAARSITLEQRRLFIFPTAAGFFFLATLLIMLLTAINYQNNMAYGLTFWLAMLFIVAVHFTHGNLLGLTMTAVAAEAVFAYQQSGFTLRLSGGGKRAGHYSVRLLWPDAEQVVDVGAGQGRTVTLHQAVGQRGYFLPPRLRIESVYPLGLLRCWSFAYFDCQALVYPQPLPAPDVLISVNEKGTLGTSDSSGLDDLAGFRAYQVGDSARHIDWRAWARGQALQTRLYSAPSREEHWLDWNDFDGGNTEQRLSWLCWRIIQLDASGDDYGLRLPNVEIPLAAGDRQREVTLRALALYDMQPPGTGYHL